MNRTASLLPLLDERRPGGTNDNYGCVPTEHPYQSHVRPITTAGSRLIVSRRPTRPGSPEAPSPGVRTLREGPSPVQAASLGIFMQVQPPETASRASSRGTAAADSQSDTGRSSRRPTTGRTEWLDPRVPGTGGMTNRVLDPYADVVSDQLGHPSIATTLDLYG